MNPIASPTCPTRDASNPLAAAWRTSLLSLGAVLLVACGDKNSSDQPTGAAVASVASVAAPSPANTEEKTLHFSNWPDYIPPGLIAAFERESGIKVHYKTYKSNEELMERLSSGKLGDDLVVPSSHFAALQIDKSLLRPLDKGLLPNLVNMEPSMLESLAGVDPGNRYLVPWAWGYTTVGINTTQVEKALAGTPMPANAWELVFNPTYTAKLRQCGIGVLDSPTEVIPAALHYLGRPAYSTTPEDLQAASEMLAKVRPHVKTFSTSLISDLASGKVCVVLGWSGDIGAAISEAASAGSKDRFDLLIPSTGGLLFIDTLAIPASATHPKNAQAFINFFLRPENAALMSNELSYPTGNKAAVSRIQPDVLANETIFLKDEHVQRLVPPAKMDTRARVAMTQAYVGFAYGVGGQKPAGEIDAAR